MALTAAKLASSSMQRVAEPLASKTGVRVPDAVLEQLEKALKKDSIRAAAWAVPASGVPIGHDVLALLAEFDESKHPRDEHGRFTGSTALPPSSEDPAPGSRYYYHQAPRGALEKIAEEGIAPSKGSGIVSLSPHLGSVHEWSGLIGRKDDENVLLRVPRAGVRPVYTGEPIEEFDEEGNENPDYDPEFPMRTTEYDPRDSSAELGARGQIPAHRLEAYIGGRWVKLKKDFRSSEFDESKHNRDERGRFSSGPVEAFERGTDAARKKVVWEVAGPSEAQFIHPSGKLFGSHEDDHYSVARRLGMDLYKDVIPGGMIRYAPEAGAEIGAPITRAQARAIIDGSRAYSLDVIGIDVYEGQKRYTKEFDTERVTVDALRTWVNSKYPKSRQNAASGGTSLHRAADKLAPRFEVAVRLAFARGRKAIKRSNPDAEDAVASVRESLKNTLPKVLRKAYVAGGNAAAGMLRVAEFNPDQPRDERGRWTDAVDAVDNFSVPKDFTLADAQYDVDTKIPLDTMVVASVDLSLLSSEYGADYRVRKMAEAIKQGAKLPALTLEQRSHVGLNILDGRTRIAALRELGITTGKVPAVIRLEDFGTESSLPKGVTIDKKRTESLRRGFKAAEFREEDHPRDSGGRFTDGSTESAPTAEWFRAAKRGEFKEKRRGPISFTFDAASDEAISWADKHAAELIDGISETTREAINDAIAESLESGTDPYDEILEAVGSPERARRIAHHEPMLAVHEGQREAWRQAVDEGLLTGTESVTWIVTGDDKVCPICLGLEDKTRKVDGQYRFDGEEYDGPPAHVGCRCTEGLVG